MAEFPALPLWTDAYLGDCDHLSDAEHGRYFLVLIALWRAPRQRLPNDLIWLARKFRRSVQAFEIEILPVMREFCVCDGNWWTQKRIKKEWAYVKKTSVRQTKRAKARWQKENGINSGIASLHQSGNGPTPTPTPTPLDKNASTATSSPELTNNGAKQNYTNGSGISVANGHNSYASQAARDDWGTQKVVELMTKAGIDQSWAVAMSAEDTADPAHEKSCRLMRKFAKQGGIGWVSPERRKHQ